MAVVVKFTKEGVDNVYLAEGSLPEMAKDLEIQCHGASTLFFQASDKNGKDITYDLECALDGKC